MGEVKVGPREMQLRIMREQNYARKNARTAERAATIENLKVVAEQAKESAGKKKAARKGAKTTKKRRS
jgi:hypothetical protein